jgi:hypothetical protein
LTEAAPWKHAPVPPEYGGSGIAEFDEMAAGMNVMVDAAAQELDNGEEDGLTTPSS